MSIPELVLLWVPSPLPNLRWDQALVAFVSPGLEMRPRMPQMLSNYVTRVNE